MTITQERAKILFNYNPDTGILKRTLCTNRLGDYYLPEFTAGTSNKGYVILQADGKKYAAHRMIYLIMTGSFPPDRMVIDHINGVRNDNRWCNLRLATKSQNHMNRNISCANKSGKTGVSWVSKRSKWDSRIKIDRKTILLGQFDKLEDAIAARVDAEKRIFKEFRKV